MSEQSHLLHAPVDPRLGTVIKDKYKIVRKLGEGGMGAVYEGEHLLIKRKVAIKCLHANFAANEQIVQRFHNEALAATSIGHEHIVDVTDMDRFDDGTIFMVLEYLKGQELADVLRNEGPQPLPRVVHIMAQVCDALAAAHAKGIVHRDLKPENIFLVKRSHDPDFVKLLDFGIAKFKDVGEQGQGMTQTGTVMGTPHYMSPEQAQGARGIDHRADIYSLSVIIFHALTGRLPFEAESFPMLVVAICSQPPPSLRVYRPDLPEDLEALVMRMMSKVPAERPSDCGFIKEALQRYGGFPSGIVLGDSAPSLPGSYAMSPTGPSFSSSLSGTTQAPTEGKSKAPLLAGMIVLLLVLIGGGVGAVFGLGLIGGEEAAPPPPPPPVVIPPTPPPVENNTKVATAEPPSTPTPSEKTVRVQIEALPPTAELFLDGHRIANPFDADLPQQDDPRVLEAKLADYETVRQELSLRFPQRVKIHLERGDGVRDQGADVVKTSGPRRGDRPTKTATTPTEPPPVRPPPVRPPPVKTTPTEPPPPRNDLKKIRIP